MYAGHATGTNSRKCILYVSQVYRRCTSSVPQATRNPLTGGYIGPSHQCISVNLTMPKYNTSCVNHFRCECALRLSISERSQIANCFEAHFSRNKKVCIAWTWLGFLPIAHAHTLRLFIAYRRTKNPTFQAYSGPETLQKAWEAQLTSVPSILKEVDVDLECLASLEEEMFENTDPHTIATWYHITWKNGG